MSVEKTDAKLEEEWKNMYMYKDFDENGNDEHKLRKIQELQNQIYNIEQQGLSSRFGGKSVKRKNKKNTKIKTKTKKNKNKSRRRCFKKRMQ